MAKRRRRRRRRNQLVPILVAMLLIILVAVAGIVTGFIKKYTPSDTRMELADYYHTGEGEAALICRIQSVKQKENSRRESLFALQRYNK